MGDMVRAVFLLLFLFPFWANAVSIPTLGPTLELVPEPQFPRAGETVTVRAENYGAGTATFIWSVNGRVIDQGVGVTSLTVPLTATGNTTEVSVVVTNNGVRSEKTISLTPAEIDIVWEGKTVTPPLFHGLPLPNPNSAVTLYAVPHIIHDGVRVNADSLTYVWYINDSATPTASGYGKNSITVRPPQFLNPFSVSVRAQTEDGTVETYGRTTIRPVQPEILVYEKAPLLGYRFDRAIQGAFQLSGDETTLTAFPLYINNLVGPSYTWSVDSNPITDTRDGGREVTFRKTGEGSGVFSLSFALQNANALFERATHQFLLRF